MLKIDPRVSRRAVVLLAACASNAAAQSGDRSISIAAQAIPVYTHSNAFPGGGARDELRLEQPTLMASGRLFRGHVLFSSALSMERLTTRDGVLTVGAWGGGLYDRQHPHGYLHEAVVSLVGNIGQADVSGAVSLSGGKGVVPFGTDPPMSRAPLRAPVNHGWSQLMELWFGAIGFKTGRIGFEASVFDDGGGGGPIASTAHDSTGHGHECATECPKVSTVLPSSARLTLWPVAGVEFRASYATMNASGHHAGAGGGNHRLLNLSTSVARNFGQSHVSALVEVGQAKAERTYSTALFEAQWSLRRARVYTRLEQTERAEGPRTSNPFHALPEPAGQSAGVTRWTVHTLGIAVSRTARALTIEPLLEGSLARAASIGIPTVADALYGDRRMWSVLFGVRCGFGARHAMGRYGALSDHGRSGHH